MAKKDKELYDNEYEPAGLKWMSLAVVVLAVSGFVALAWYAYSAGQKEIHPDDVLIVEADGNDYRVKPEEPGGQDFKYKDKAIYENLSEEKRPQTAPTQVVKVEAPVRPDIAPRTDMPEDFGKVEEAAPKKKITTYVSPIPKPVEEEAKAAPVKAPVVKEAKAPEKLMNPDAFAPVTPEEEKKMTAPKEEPKPAPVPEPIKAKPAATGNHSVQLGAFRSNEEAMTNWDKIRRSHLDVLDGLSNRIVRADLGEKGVYYRLRALGLKDKAAATDLCKTLAARKQPCFYSGTM